MSGTGGAVSPKPLRKVGTHRGPAVVGQLLLVVFCFSCLQLLLWVLFPVKSPVFWHAQACLAVLLIAMVFKHTTKVFSRTSSLQYGVQTHDGLDLEYSDDYRKDFRVSLRGLAWVSVSLALLTLVFSVYGVTFDFSLDLGFNRAYTLYFAALVVFSFLNSLWIFWNVERILMFEEESFQGRQASDEATKHKSEFVSFLAHEIRNPLHAILGLSDLILKQHSGSYELIEDKIQTIRSCASLMTTILDDVLDFQRLEHNALKLEEISFSLPSFVKVIDQFGRNASSTQGLEWSVYADSIPENMILLGDPTRLKQILFNLITNAVKFTKKGGVKFFVAAHENKKLVDLSLSEKKIGEIMVEFAVEDSGIGISSDRLPFIFGRFTQAESSIFRKFGGSGLGLAIVHMLLTKMRGSIGVVSTLGVGSKFSVTIPFSVDVSRLKEHPGKGTIKEFLTVLLVDDDAANRDIATMIFESAGFTVYVAVDGLDALEKCEEKSLELDFILMDVLMPRMNGIEATRELRKRGITVPIIALSGYDSQVDEDECYLAGMDAFLMKPVSAQKIKEVYHEVCSRPLKV